MRFIRHSVDRLLSKDEKASPLLFSSSLLLIFSWLISSLPLCTPPFYILFTVPSSLIYSPSHLFSSILFSRSSALLHSLLPLICSPPFSSPSHLFSSILVSAGELADFRAQFDSQGNSIGNKIYIIKPDTGCQGRGIFLTRTFDQVPQHENVVAQLYIKKPLLLDGFKFDLRIYCLVSSVKPLRMYLFHDGLVRMCTEEYVKPTKANISNTCMHLTNYAVNKHNSNFQVKNNLFLSLFVNVGALCAKYYPSTVLPSITLTFAIEIYLYVDIWISSIPLQSTTVLHCTALHCTARCLPLPPHSQSTRGPHLWQVLSMLINSIYLFISLSLALPVYPFSSLLLHIFLSISPYHSISPTLYTSPLNPLSKSLSRYSFISIYLFLFRSIRTNWYTFLFLHQSHHLNLKICPSSLLPALSVHLTLFVYFSAFAIHFLSYSVPPSYSFSLSNCVYPSDSDFVSHSDSLYLTVSVSVSLSFSNCLSATFC